MSTYLVEFKGNFTKETVSQLSDLYLSSKKFAQLRGDRIVYKSVYGTGKNLAMMALNAQKDIPPVTEFLESVKHYVKHEVENAERLAPVSEQYITMSLPLLLDASETELSIGLECDEDELVTRVADIETDVEAMKGTVSNRSLFKTDLNGFKQIDTEYVKCIAEYRRHLNAEYPLGYADWCDEYHDKDEIRNETIARATRYGIDTNHDIDYDEGR